MDIHTRLATVVLNPIGIRFRHSFIFCFEKTQVIDDMWPGKFGIRPSRAIIKNIGHLRHAGIICRITPCIKKADHSLFG